MTKKSKDIRHLILVSLFIFLLLNLSLLNISDSNNPINSKKIKPTPGIHEIIKFKPVFRENSILVTSSAPQVITPYEEIQKLSNLGINVIPTLPIPEVQVSSSPDRGSFTAEDVNLMLSNKFDNDNRKIVFLTFDDGPSTTVTPKILSILDKYNIKATFFVLGSMIMQSEESKQLLVQIYKSGHSIGNHTYSHNYSKIFPHNRIDIDSYFDEIGKTDTILKNILGQNFQTRLMRMPGGYESRQYYKDPNLYKFNEVLKKKNMVNIDWNALNSDSEGRKKNSKDLFAMAQASIGNKSKVVLLMHDTYGKEETAIALPRIIEYLNEQGFEFATIQQ